MENSETPIHTLVASTNTQTVLFSTPAIVLLAMELLLPEEKGEGGREKEGNMPSNSSLFENLQPCAFALLDDT